MLMAWHLQNGVECQSEVHTDIRKNLQNGLPPTLKMNYFQTFILKKNSILPNTEVFNENPLHQIYPQLYIKLLFCSQISLKSDKIQKFKLNFHSRQFLFYTSKHTYTCITFAKSRRNVNNMHMYQCRFYAQCANTVCKTNLDALRYMRYAKSLLKWV